MGRCGVSPSARPRSVRYDALMRRPFVAVLALSLFAVALPARPQPAPPRPSPVAGARPACVQVTPQPVFNGSGFNHLVHVDNRCAQAVSCTVTTDINPQAQSATIPSQGTHTFNTFFNAAAYGFTPTVRCAAVSP